MTRDMPIEKDDMLGAALLAAAATISGLLLRGIGWMIGRSLQSIINDNNAVVLRRFQDMLRESVAPMEERAAMRYHESQVHFKSIDDHLRLQDERVNSLSRELEALTKGQLEIKATLEQRRRGI